MPSAPRLINIRPAVTCGSSSRLANVELAPPDPILGVSEAFKASKSPNKLNLGVGAYRTEELQPLVLEVVKKVMQSGFCHWQHTVSCSATVQLQQDCC